jgi:hypothetical protein
MRLDQHLADVEAHQVSIGARREVLPAVLAWQRVERLQDRRVLIAADLGLAPDRNVVGCRRSRKQRLSLLGLEVLERHALRRAVPPSAVLLETPAPRVIARLLDARSVVQPGAKRCIMMPCRVLQGRCDRA